jgi:hypothetical protein
MQWQQNVAENPQRSHLTQVNGQSFANIGYQLDGIDNRDAILARSHASRSTCGSCGRSGW